MVMMTSHKNFTFLILILWVGITIVLCGKTPMKKRSLVSLNGGSEDQSLLSPSSADAKHRLNKRTFCNAFTGCGKKRSDGSFPVKDFAEYDQQQQQAPAAAAAMDNSDDFVDDVARDILAEARLWEALQARTSMRRPFRQGFFPRQRRSVQEQQDEEQTQGKPLH